MWTDIKIWSRSGSFHFLKNVGSQTSWLRQGDRQGIETQVSKVLPHWKLRDEDRTRVLRRFHENQRMGEVRRVRVPLHLGGIRHRIRKSSLPCDNSDTSQEQMQMLRIRKETHERAKTTSYASRRKAWGLRKSGRIQTQAREKRRIQALLSRSKQRRAFFCWDPAGWLDGGLPGKGARTDLRKALVSHKSYYDLVRDDPGSAARLGRVARDYYVLGDNRTIADRKPEVVWLYGPTGSGKTSMARKYFEFLQGSGDGEITNYIRTPGPIKWWDGYEGDLYTVIDDFRRNQLRDVGGFAYLLRLLDRYPVRVEIKGGSVPFVAHYIVITCPRHPEDEFTYRGIGGDADRIEEDVAQLIRRLDRIVRVGTPANPTQILDVSGDVWAKYGLGEPPRDLRFDDFLHRSYSQYERLGERLAGMDE